eukprot:scaffold37491_cov30-Tisochrysis_lutea.AAC.6
MRLENVDALQRLQSGGVLQLLGVCCLPRVWRQWRASGFGAEWLQTHACAPPLSLHAPISLPTTAPRVPRLALDALRAFARMPVP